MESPDTAAFTVEVGLTRAEYVRQVYGTARATLARSRGNDFEFRDRAAEPLSAPERRSRGGGLPRDRTPSPATPPPPPDSAVPTWAEERAAVLQAIRMWDEERAPILDAIRGLGELCETLHERITQLQTQPWHPIYREMAQWGEAERTAIEQESLQQQREKEEPFEIPPLHTLRQN